MNNTPNMGIVSSDAAGDHAFALGAKRGEERAFGILFKRYQAKIFAVALRCTGIAEDAEDIVQQTFQKAFSCGNSLSYLLTKQDAVVKDLVDPSFVNDQYWLVFPSMFTGTLALCMRNRCGHPRRTPSMSISTKITLTPQAVGRGGS